MCDDYGVGRKEGAYGECASDGVKTDVYFVNKVGWMADAQERASVVNIILPLIDLFIILEGEIDALLSGLNNETIRLEINPFDIGNVSKSNETLMY